MRTQAEPKRSITLDVLALALCCVGVLLALAAIVIAVH
jgi:hypothetical protein